MIELRGITVGYDGRAVLRDIDLVLEEGELTLVSGRTGVGKSTLLGVLTGLVPRFTGGELSGDLLVEGHSILHLPPRERAEVIGHVGQDPAAGFVTDTVEEELAYGMEQLGVPPATMRRRVEETLDLLGIAELRSRDLRTLSGGQQQRVAIGAVLTTHPKVLVLDEPTSALDPTAAEDVLAVLARLVEDLGITVVLAEHRLERVLPFADRLVLVTGDGAVREGAPAEILESSPVVPPLIELGRWAGWRPLPLTVRAARRSARGLLPAGAQPEEAAPTAGEALLRAEGVVVRHGRRVAVDRLGLQLDAGTVTVLMGRNGAGKSSLLWALQGSGSRAAGAVRVRSGGAAVRGGWVDTAELSAGQRRERVGLVPQNPADLLYLESVAEECAAAGTSPELLDRLVPGVDPAAHPRDLSEGQRLALAVSLVLGSAPGVLLLDEPTRGLDYPGKARLAQVLRALAAEGRAVLLATHDVEFAAQVADRAVVMADGEVVSRGTARVVLTESPAFAPQVTKVLGAPWLRVDEVEAAVGER